MNLTAGQVVDRYELVRPLGEGGMAVVWLARHTTLGSLHAMKVLTLRAPGVRERLLREGRVQATLQHDNAVTVTDVVQVDGLPGLVLEYVDGPTLDAWLLNGPPPLIARITVLRQVADAVAAAHAIGLVHRDLKPGNVLIATTQGGPRAKVTDFGIAKVLSDDAREAEASHETPRTRAGVAMGTPTYMAPEQLRDAAGVDARADVFALGVMLYESLTLHGCFQPGSLVELYERTTSRSYTDPAKLQPEAPTTLLALIDACLSPDPSERPADASKVRNLLDDVFTSLQTPDAEPPATLRSAAPPTVDAGLPTLGANRPLNTPLPTARIPPPPMTTSTARLGTALGAGVLLLGVVGLVGLFALFVGLGLGSAVIDVAKSVANPDPTQPCRVTRGAPLGYAQTRTPVAPLLGRTWTVPRDTRVFPSVPEAAKPDLTPAFCTLPAGTKVVVEEAAIRVRGQGAFIKVHGDNTTLLEPAPTTP